MSYDATTWAWRADVRGTKKIVLLYLADLADEDGLCFPGSVRMTERCGVGRSAGVDALKQLEKDGFIRRENRYRLNGSQRSNCYALRLSGNPDGQVGGVQNPDGRGSGQPDPLTHQEVPGGKNSADAEQEAAPSEPALDEPLDVWRHYVQAMKPRRESLDDQERRLIRDALKVATLGEVKRAIDGCASSTWHMGQNDKRKAYNKLSQIIRGRRGKETTRERIDFFIELADKAGVSKSGVQSADPVKVKDNKRRVMAGWEFPNDAIVVRQAKDAENWLAERGVVVERDEMTGRPTFRWR
jgi:hypothetical protein